MCDADPMDRETKKTTKKTGTPYRKHLNYSIIQILPPTTTRMTTTNTNTASTTTTPPAATLKEACCDTRSTLREKYYRMTGRRDTPAYRTLIMQYCRLPL